MQTLNEKQSENLLSDLLENSFEAQITNITENSFTLRFEERVEENEEDTIKEILNSNQFAGMLTFSLNGFGATDLIIKR